MAIPDHFTIQFGKNFESVAQQTSSRFKKCAMVETGVTGEGRTHNLALPVEDSETTGERLANTVLRELDTQKRWIRPRTFDVATVDVPWDEVFLAPTILPGGKHLEAHHGAYARRIDEVFVTGAFGTNYVGKEGVTPAEIPASNVVSIDFVGVGTPSAALSMTVDKIIRAKRILTENESFGDDARSRGITLWGAMTPEMEEAILFLANASGGSAANRLFSRDFMPPKIDENGNISNFLGINWIRSTLLPSDAVDPTIRYAGIWTSDAIYLDIWGDIQTRVSERADKKYATQFFTHYGMNACRSEDKKVVKIATKVAA